MGLISMELQRIVGEIQNVFPHSPMKFYPPGVETQTKFYPPGVEMQTKFDSGF